MRSKWAWLVATVIAVVVPLTLVSLRAVESRRLERSLAIARLSIRGGDISKAARLLGEIEKQRPSWGEVAYQLGVCEQLRGRPRAAIAAWSRVPSDSEFAPLAAARHGRALIDSGRFAPAESLLEGALLTAGKDAAEVRRELELLYQFEGRTADVRRLILDSWPDARDPAAVLKKLHIFEITPYPVDAVRVILDRADGEDDRVWLSRANLATRIGRFQEARSWLDRCERKRPGDRAVTRSGLELCIAAGDAPGAREASSRLPASEMSRVEVLQLRAWLAAHAGGPSVEGAALEALLKEDGGNVRALDRLAELAQEKGRSAEAAEFRRRKAEVNAAREAYRRLLDFPDPIERAGDFIRLAVLMGRPMEARGWTLVRDLARPGAGPGRPPLITSDAAAVPTTRTLSESVNDLPAPADSRAPSTSTAGQATSLAFLDEARSIGLGFVHDAGNPPGRVVPPAFMCGGLALLDYDDDGWLDVYAVQAGRFPPRARPQAPQTGRWEGDRLFRNRGDGTFEDATERAGISKLGGGYGHGVTVADYDNDGHPDLFLTRWRAYALFRNRGDGTFEDVTDKAGLAGDRDWPTSAAFADLDDDGDLDLYVCHYLKYDEDDPRLCNRPGLHGGHDCNPRDFPSLPDHLFRNDNGRFVDVTAESGIVDADGRGLGVVAAHLDDDDRIDLFVANDSTANFLFRNLGGFRFEEAGHTSGVAANSSGSYQAGMGVACGDLDGDGRLDLAVTNFYGESTSFFRNLGGGFFADRTAAINLAIPTRHLLGFGIVFLDADDDGRLDILTANGHIHDGRPQYPYIMPAQLLLQGADGRLSDASGRAGEPFQGLHLGRGLASGDLDNDGRTDALMLAQDEHLVAFRNRSERGHSITLQLRGTASNRDAVGARVTVVAGGRAFVAQRTAGGSFQSSCDPRIHIGLGQARKVDRIEVRWPSGRRDRIEHVEADGAILWREGCPGAPLPGWRRRS